MIDDLKRNPNAGVANQRPWSLIACAIGSALTGLLVLLSPLMVGSAVSVGLAMLLVMILPGFMLLTLVNARASVSPWGALAIALGVGLAIFEAIALAVTSLGGVPALAVTATFVLNCLLCGLMAVQRRRGKLMSWRWADAPRAQQADLWLVVLIALPLAAYLLEIQYRLPSANSDWAQYLTHITWLVRHPGLPYQPHTAATQELNYRLTISGWLSAQAALAGLFQTHTSTLDIYWKSMPPFMIAGAIAAVYGLACELFRGAAARVAAVVGLLLYVFGSMVGAGQGHFEWAGYSLLYRMTEDKVVMSFLLVPMLAHVAVAYMRDRQPAQLAVLLVISLGGSLMHPLTPPFALAIVGTYCGLTWLSKPSRQTALAAGLVVMSLLPSLALPFIQSQRQDPGKDRDLVYDLTDFDPEWYAAKEANFGDRILILSWGDNNFIVSPDIAAYPLAVLGCLIGLASGFWLRRSPGARLIFAGTFAPLAMMYTPGLTPLVGKIIPLILIWRMLWLLPVGLSLGWGLVTMSGWLAARMRGAPRAWPMLAASAVVVVTFAALGTMRDIAKGVQLIIVPEFVRQGENDRISLAMTIDQTVTDGRAVLSLPAEDTNNLLMSLASDVRTPYYIRAADPETFTAALRFFDHAAIDAGDVDLLVGANVGTIVMPHDSPMLESMQPPDFTLVKSLPAGVVYRVSPNNTLGVVYFSVDNAHDDYDAIVARLLAEAGPDAFLLLDARGRWPLDQYDQLATYLSHNYDNRPKVGQIPNQADANTILQLASDRKRIYAVMFSGSPQDAERTAERAISSAFYVTSIEEFGRLRLFSLRRLDTADAKPVDSDARFGEAISLESYAVSTNHGKPGDVMGVTLTWGISQPVPTRYKVFVHILDAQGNLVAQDDSEPVRGLSPTDTWAMGTAVIDKHAIALPADLPDGIYHVAVGLYTDVDGRLQVSVPGQAAADLLLLADLTVAH